MWDSAFCGCRFSSSGADNERRRRPDQSRAMARPATFRLLRFIPAWQLPALTTTTRGTSASTNSLHVVYNLTLIKSTVHPRSCIEAKSKTKTKSSETGLLRLLGTLRVRTSPATLNVRLNVRFTFAAARATKRGRRSLTFAIRKRPRVELYDTEASAGKITTGTVESRTEEFWGFCGVCGFTVLVRLDRWHRGCGGAA